MEIAAAIIGSGALSALISGIFGLIKDGAKKNTETEEKTKLLTKAVRLLILGELERQADRHRAKGSISQKNLKWFLETYEAYKSLGGDGYADSMKADVESLWVETE